jgi:Fe-S-cluster containining protein
MRAGSFGHVAIMLPFELEYLLSRTNIDASALQRAPVEIANGLTIEIGFVTSAIRCPFLTADYRCGIHDNRPMDCRSFPLIPVFGSDGSLGFRIDTDCPSESTFAVEYQDRMKSVWQDLLPHLPMAYRMVYNRL